MPFFVVGVFIIAVSILKKTEPTLPKVFKTVARNTIFFGLTVVVFRLKGTLSSIVVCSFSYFRHPEPGIFAIGLNYINHSLYIMANV